MPETATIPSVQTFTEFIIAVNGNEIPQTVRKVSVNVMKTVNKISSALLVLLDGDPATGKFPLSEGELFKPGNDIQISTGDADQPIAIFKGIIIKQSLKIRGDRASQLILDCRHKAVKCTVGRKNACFHDSTDSDAMSRIFKTYGFSDTDIEASTLTHKELVEYNCTDWDFLLNRAEIMGKMILTNDETIVVKAPVVGKAADYSLLYGDNMMELDAEMDSRNQYKAVTVKTWDISEQAIAESDASEPKGIQDQGNFSTDDLAAVIGLEEYALNYAGTLSADERKAWADAQMLKSRLSKIRGRVKFGGIAAINPGDTLELKGLGDRFNGNAFVSGVRQDYDAVSGWKTQAQFGHDPQWFATENEITDQKAGGMLPGVIGLHTAIVTDNEDPEGEMRVRVKFPYINPDDDGVWARIALADAGNERGMFFRPEVGDEVVTGFLYEDPRQPVILGMLHSSALPSPIQASNDNNQKGYTSREKLILLFDDDKKEVRIETPAGNKVTISEDQKTISLEDQNGNKIQMNDKGITVNDKNNDTITLQDSKISVKGISKVVVDAPQIELVENASHPLVFGDSLLTYLNQVVTMFNTHMHPGELAMGLPVTPAPPVPPLPPPTPALLSISVKTG